MTDWGAHMFDVAQWALGKDRNGPVEIIPPGHSYYDHLAYLYDNGVVMTEEPRSTGTKQGALNSMATTVGYRYVAAKCFASDPVFLPEYPNKKRRSGPYETRIPHQINFIESVRSRIDPTVPVEIGHSSCTVCNLGNIAYKLGRPVKWNPIVERIPWTTQTQPHCCITPTATAIRWKADIRTAAADSRHSSRDTLPPGVFSAVPPGKTDAMQTGGI
ncbi:MAG: hypothetical protein ACLR8Y_22960 [Alistipes indistinctus]